MFVDTDSLIMTIHDSYKVSLSPSDNFRLPKVLPDVPPVVLLDVHLEVHLEVLTYSDHIHKSYQPILGPSNLSRTRKPRKNFLLEGL